MRNLEYRAINCRQESRSAVSLRRAASASPLHSASVQVTDVSSLANPAPVGGRTKENFGEDYLSPTRLVSKPRDRHVAVVTFTQRQLSGKRDLGQVNYLQISVNTQTSSLGNFGGSSRPLLSRCLHRECRRQCSQSGGAEVCGECGAMSEGPGDEAGETEGSLAASL